MPREILEVGQAEEVAAVGVSPEPRASRLDALEAVRRLQGRPEGGTHGAVAGRRQAWRERITGFQSRFVTYGLRLVAKWIFRFRIEISGREHVPAGEPVIVAGGPHRNWIDGFLILIAMPPEPRVVFLGTENVFNSPQRRALIALVGGVHPVSTTSAHNREVLETALEVLARGDRLGIFPEGWLHLDDPLREIGELQRGLAYIAQRSGRRVLPLAIAGSKPLWRGKTLRVRIGPPLDPPPPTARKAEQEAWSEEVRAVLRDLLPPDPPTIPIYDRRWTWLTNWLN